MKTKLQFSTTALLGLALSGVFALAAQSRAAQSGQIIGHIQRTDQLIGKPVMSSDNQKVGNIDNFVVDLESDRILYAVVNTGKGKVAVDTQVLPNITANGIRASVDKAKLEGAPQFTSALDNPAQLSKADFPAQVNQYFGIKNWWSNGSTPDQQAEFHNVHKATDLKGMKVVDVQNQPFGTVDTAVLDLAPARVTYVLLSPDRSLQVGANNVYALPPEMLTLSQDKTHLVSNLDRAKLAAAPHFDKSKMPNLADPTFASQVYNYYGKQSAAYFERNLQPTGR